MEKKQEKEQPAKKRRRVPAESGDEPEVPHRPVTRKQHKREEQAKKGPVAGNKRHQVSHSASDEGETRPPTPKKPKRNDDDSTDGNSDEDQRNKGKGATQKVCSIGFFT